MNLIFFVFFFLTLALSCANASDGPEPVPPAPTIIVPEDKPYPGVIKVAVDASDIDHRIIRIHESIPVESGKELVLLYPKWLPGWHAPQGQINRVAGISIHSHGTLIEWTRDPVDMYAFHVAVPSDADVLEVEFQYLSPVNSLVGTTEVTGNILTLEWSSVVLYPAGYFARRISVDASVKYPSRWHFATALEALLSDTHFTQFKQVNLETLIDSPFFAGLYNARIDLDPGADAPVSLDLFAERPELLAAKPEHLERHRAVVQQAYKLFGTRHYDHFDFLLTLSDNISLGGLEHHRSSQNNSYASYFTEYDKRSSFRFLLPHEYIHSWNGKFRRPADLWTPNFNTPMRNSLLRVYEGLTEYWGHIITARSGLWSRDEFLDEIAAIAAYHSITAGRKWRPLEDTTNDEIINPRTHPLSWSSWQRFEDYYNEGLLIWLDADTLIREHSNGLRSLDDFAKDFFGINQGSFIPLTYNFDDVVAGLNKVEPFDWEAFFRTRTLTIRPHPPLDGIFRGGHKLVFTETPGTHYKSGEARQEVTNLLYSIGLTVDKTGNIKNVLWEGPAFRATLSAGVQILAVNGRSFDEELFKDAIKAAQRNHELIELIIKDQDRFRVVKIEYYEGLRYPHLERDITEPARLDDIIAAKK